MKPIALLVVAGNETYFGKSYGAQEILAAGVGEGLLDPGGYSPGDVLGASLTETGRARLMAGSTADLSGPDDAWNRLWAWLLVHGGVKESEYSGLRPEACLHLAECGLDTGASTTPADDGWTEFAGTFAEDERFSGLSGKASCRCGLVKGVTVYAEYPELSLAGMIRAATGDWDAFIRGVTG